MSLIGAMYPATAPPPVDAAPTTTVWSPPGRTESGLARVREATAGELEAWDTLIARFWNHRVTHRRSWIESLAGSGCGQPLYLVWEKRGEVVGCMPGLLARVGLWRGFGSPLPGWQTVSLGPVWDRRRVSARELLALLVPYLQLLHRVSYIELMTSDLAPALMRALGFRGEPAPTFCAPLYPDDEKRTFRGLKDRARRTRYRWYRPTELMTWTVMQRALQAGYLTFDLNGEGAFKEKFGAVPDATKHRWVLSDPPWLTSLRFWAERGYRVQQAIRGHLARFVGLGS